MDLNEMKVGDLLKLVGLLNARQPDHPFVGKYVICRCYSAGVHAGELVSQTGDEAVLKNSRRLWAWKAKAGVALSGLAINGLESGKIDTLLPEIALTGVIETIPCSAVSEASVNGYK